MPQTMADEGWYTVVCNIDHSLTLEKCEEEVLEAKPNNVFVLVEKERPARLLVGSSSNEDQVNFARSKCGEFNKSRGMDAQALPVLSGEAREHNPQKYAWKSERDYYPLASVRVLSASRIRERAGECHEHCGGYFTRGLVKVFESGSKVTWRTALSETTAFVKQAQKANGEFKENQRPQFLSNTAPDIDKPIAFRCNRSSNEHEAKSLLIGINYETTNGPDTLRGCHYDVRSMMKLLEQHGYNTEEGSSSCRVLVDDAAAEHSLSRQPTYNNIVRGVLWLTEGAKSGDSLFLYYSGHGGAEERVLEARLEEEENDEDEEDDEDGRGVEPMLKSRVLHPVIVPVDAEEADDIHKDLLTKLLFRDLPEGVVVTVIADSCYSGSFLDLPFRLR